MGWHGEVLDFRLGGSRHYDTHHCDGGPTLSPHGQREGLKTRTTSA
jgi:hypothetical protein